MGEGAAALRGEALESMPCKACVISSVTLIYMLVEDEKEGKGELTCSPQSLLDQQQLQLK